MALVTVNTALIFLSPLHFQSHGLVFKDFFTCLLYLVSVHGQTFPVAMFVSQHFVYFVKVYNKLQKCSSKESPSIIFSCSSGLHSLMAEACGYTKLRRGQWPLSVNFLPNTGSVFTTAAVMMINKVMYVL